ncbi:MAG TPA: thioredoxin family protein, partial [Fibrobacteraceae bacterium]|nr:thioredoxin family protein [Fibrobacteraceae bacterium]
PIPLKKNDSSILVLLFFAFIGGFILNLMPCVLPVLSLKLFSLIKQSGKSRKRLFTLGLSMTGGILFSFWILATIIISLKSAGSLVGWGIQFQSIGFIAFMVILLSAFAMNFFGFFEIWLPGKTLTKMDGFTKKEGLAGAFFTGSLLVLLSTPCSAPFLGSAMGFAFSASAPVLFLFFTVAGLGLSLPYLIITLFPVLLSIFPKPGPWMVSLQKWMGLLLLGTVLWLLWVAKQTVGLEGFFLLIILSLMSMGFSFLTGKIAPPYKPFYREILLLLSSVLILFFTWQFAVSPTIDKALKEKKAAAFSLEKDESGFFPYSKEHLTSALEAGQPVLLDITADWCLTCKANEAAVLSQESLGYVLDKHNVVKIKADWTLQDKEISELLKSLGRSGVPVYAIYLPHNPQNPILLPEILTTNSILDVLDSNQ